MHHIFSLAVRPAVSGIDGFYGLRVVVIFAVIPMGKKLDGLIRICRNIFLFRQVDDLLKQYHAHALSLPFMFLIFSFNPLSRVSTFSVLVLNCCMKSMPP